MTDRHDIWHRISDHEESPPPEVFDKLRRLLTEGDAVQDESLQREAVFEKLKEHAIPPPLFLRQRIDAALGNRGSFFSRNRWYIAAAACLGLIVAGWMIYRGQLVTGAQTRVAGDRRHLIQTPVIRTPDTVSAVSANKDSSDNPAHTSVDGAGLVAARVGKTPVPFVIDGQAFPVTDNDLLFTLTNFTYPDIPAYITRPSDQPLKVEVDQYARLYISADMLRMIRESCLVLPSGRASRKARKMKRRLEGWKEKDQKRFDKGGNGSNPLDPLDLAEFIFR